MFETCVHKPNI